MWNRNYAPRMRGIGLALLLSTTLLAGCWPTRIVERPVAVPALPCRLEAPPALPPVTFRGFNIDGGVPLMATTQAELSNMAHWLEAMGHWVDAVGKCPSVKIEGE